MLLDYASLKLIWLFLIGILMIGFAVTGGFDLGVGALLPFLARSDEERRLMLNSIGPTWEGNQVWLITLGAALFAAWPFFYAAAFSSLYFAFFLVLLALILRPPGIDYRSKLPNQFWRSFWDYSLCFSGLVPSFIFGVAFGNVFLGVPFHYDDSLRSYFTGSFWALLSPYALLMGGVSLSALLTHGAFFLQLKTSGLLQARAKKASRLFGILFIILFISALIWTLYGLTGYKILTLKDVNLSLTPLDKEVGMGMGYWIQNYLLYSRAWFIPIASVVCMLMALFFGALEKFKLALFFSAAAITAAIVTIGFTLFPFLMPSSTLSNHSLTIWDAVSSHLTLSWMLWAILFLFPLVLSYTSWVYCIMRGQVSEEVLLKKNKELY